LTDPAQAADRLQISTARLLWTNGVPIVVGLLLLAAVAWPIAALAGGGLSTGDRVSAIVFIPVLLGGSALMFRLGYTQILKARIRLPVLEATDTVIRMRDFSGQEFEVSRAQVERVVWHFVGEMSSGRFVRANLEFYDSAGARIDKWAVGATAGRAAVPWLRKLGITVTKRVLP
jgi:hypothetical protein